MPNISFWDLISSDEIKKICIPTIQRDYAFGRRGKAFNRQSFLSALKEACIGSTLPLDFVYGVDNDTMFVPLDGQQRLTTLWLLHWYVAYKAGIVSDPEIMKTLMKFSYETRISSTDFCKSLCGLTPKGENKMSLRQWITSQTWFYHQYKQDPTIMGMLNVIAGTDGNTDGLEQIFGDDCDFPLIWKRLTTTKCIQFQKLKIGLDDSDELYVKMNARGKQLTDFENFKTELVRHVKNSDILDEKEALDFAAKLDCQWTDIFWENRWEENGQGDEMPKDVSIDEIYFTFINRFVRLECIKRQGDESVLLKQITNAFASFDPYKEVLDEEAIRDFITIMDNLRNNKLETSSPWGESFDFIPKYVGNKKSDISKITKTQTLLFYGYCRYLLAGKYDRDSFDEWNRVLWNICENRVDKSDLKPTMTEIDLLAPKSHDILSYLSQEDTIGCKQNTEQLLEEQRKARHLNSHPLIREMERYAFFKGAIRFLYTGADKEEDWANFEEKARNVKTLIPEHRESRHTVKLLTPYIPEQALHEIYYEDWISNNDEDLRILLLDDKVWPFLHNFLLQNNEGKSDTALHQDIMAICEKAFGGRGYLQVKWDDESRYIWTDYVARRGYYHWTSFIIGDQTYRRVSQFINSSRCLSIHKDQYERRIGDYFPALYLHFKYKDCHLTLFSNHTICLMTENWEKKVRRNAGDSDGFFSPIEDINSESDLISHIEDILRHFHL